MSSDYSKFCCQRVTQGSGVRLLLLSMFPWAFLDRQHRQVFIPRCKLALLVCSPLMNLQAWASWPTFLAGCTLQLWCGRYLRQAKWTFMVWCRCEGICSSLLELALFHEEHVWASRPFLPSRESHPFSRSFMFYTQCCCKRGKCLIINIL